MSCVFLTAHENVLVVIVHDNTLLVSQIIPSPKYREGKKVFRRTKLWNSFKASASGGFVISYQSFEAVGLPRSRPGTKISSPHGGESMYNALPLACMLTIG